MVKKVKKRTKLKLPLRIAIIIAILAILFFAINFIYEGLTRNKNNKTIYSYSLQNSLQYEVELYKNSIFDVSKLDMNQTYVSNVVKSINANFSYEYKNSKSIPINYNYTVVAKVIGEYILPDEDKKSSLWDKEYVLLETKSEETTKNIINISDKFTIDYNYFNDVALDLREKLNLPITSTIIVEVRINVIGAVDHKSVNDYQVIKMEFPLQQQAFKIKTSYSDKLFKEVKLWSDSELKDKVKREVIGFILLLIDLSIFIVLFKYIFNLKIDNAYNRRLNKILKQYGEIIVEINSAVEKEKVQIIDVKSFNELLDLEEELKIPILFYEIESDYLGEFTISHHNIIYRYLLDNDKIA